MKDKKDLDVVIFAHVAAILGNIKYVDRRTAITLHKNHCHSESSEELKEYIIVSLNDLNILKKCSVEIINENEVIVKYTP